MKKIAALSLASVLCIQPLAGSVYAGEQVSELMPYEEGFEEEAVPDTASRTVRKTAKMDTGVPEWHLYGGQLRFDSSGTIPNFYSADYAPWYSKRNEITSIYIGANIYGIGNHAFEGYPNLTSVTISGDFEENGINRIDPHWIGESAFRDCTSLSSVSILGISSLHTIYEYAFYNCKSLKSFTLPQDVNQIYDYAFAGCSQLETFDTSKNDKLARIGRHAFEGCKGLHSFYFPASVTTISPGAFLGCSALQKVTYDGTKTDWEKINIGDNNSPLLNAPITFLKGGSTSSSTIEKLIYVFSYIDLADSSVTLYKGTTKKLQFKAFATRPIWTSSNKNVATVNSKGVVTAKKKGKAVITVRVGSETDTCVVYVKNPTIKLSKKKLTLTAGKTAKLKATVKGKSKKVKWKSTKKSVASVNSKGKITAKKAGTATIIAVANGKKAKCKVTVKPKPAPKVVRRSSSSGSGGSSYSSSSSSYSGSSYSSSSSGSSSSGSGSSGSGSSSGGSSSGSFSGSGATSI